MWTASVSLVQKLGGKGQVTVIYTDSVSGEKITEVYNIFGDAIDPDFLTKRVAAQIATYEATYSYIDSLAAGPIEPFEKSQGQTDKETYLKDLAVLAQMQYLISLKLKLESDQDYIDQVALVKADLAKLG